MHFCQSQTLNVMQRVLIFEVYAADGGCARSQRSMVAKPMTQVDFKTTFYSTVSAVKSSFKIYLSKTRRDQSKN